MRLRKSIIGKPVKVEFWDNSENVGRPVWTLAYGVLAKFDRQSITIESWRTPKDDIKDGTTSYTLLRRVIEKITTLHPQQ